MLVSSKLMVDQLSVSPKRKVKIMEMVFFPARSKESATNVLSTKQL